MPGSPVYRVSPELEAVWQKHAAHIAWSTSHTGTTRGYNPNIAKIEGTIHALSPPPRLRSKKRGQTLQATAPVSATSQRLDQIREVDSESGHSTRQHASGPPESQTMQQASGSDDHEGDKERHADGCGVSSRRLDHIIMSTTTPGAREDPLSHLRERARSRKRLTLLQIRSASASGAC